MATHTVKQPEVSILSFEEITAGHELLKDFSIETEGDFFLITKDEMSGAEVIAPDRSLIIDAAGKITSILNTEIDKFYTKK